MPLFCNSRLHEQTLDWTPEAVGKCSYRSKTAFFIFKVQIFLDALYARWNCDYWIAMVYHFGATQILLGANVLGQNESKPSNVQHFAVSLRKNVKDTSASQEGH